jgi:hypothetical protein
MTRLREAQSMGERTAYAIIAWIAPRLHGGGEVVGAGPAIDPEPLSREGLASKKGRFWKIDTSPPSRVRSPAGERHSSAAGTAG